MNFLQRIFTSKRVKRLLDEIKIIEIRNRDLAKDLAVAHCEIRHLKGVIQRSKASNVTPIDINNPSSDAIFIAAASETHRCSWADSSSSYNNTCD